MTAELEWAVESRSFPGAPRGGDFGIVRPMEQGFLAVLVDATGHGLQAYAVAQKARHALAAMVQSDPERILHDLDDVLRGTIGAAVSVAHLLPDELVFAGVGNVSGHIGGRPLVVRTGVVGQNMRTPKAQRAEMKPGAWFMMYTDGVAGPPGVPHGSAETAARLIVEQHGQEHDDASVLLARWREETT
jgi:hypothetical protein